MTDILAAIDAAVDERCACGCGRKLQSNGASAYWATEACQIQWQRRNADTDPPVDDNAPVTIAEVVEFMYGSDYAVWLREEIERRTPPAKRDRTYQPQPTVVGSHATRVYETSWVSGLRGSLRWRRRCHGCGDVTDVAERLHFPRGSRVSMFTLDETFPVVEMSEQVNACAGCGWPIDGPRLLARYRFFDDLHGRRWAMQLIAGDDGESAFLIEQATDCPEAVVATWDELEHRLMDRITYRDPCTVVGCSEKARYGYDVRRSIACDDFTVQPGKARLCVRHHFELDSAIMMAGHMLPRLPEDL